MGLMMLRNVLLDKAIDAKLSGMLCMLERMKICRAFNRNSDIHNGKNWKWDFSVSKHYYNFFLDFRKVRGRQSK